MSVDVDPPEEFDPEAERQVLHEMLVSMDRARDALEDQDLDTAVDAIDGMTSETDCGACIGVETYLLALLAALRMAPGGRKGRVAELVIGELETFCGRLREVL